MIQTPAVKYYLYARKSSESDERQAMSIDSQIKEMHSEERQLILSAIRTRFVLTQGELQIK